MSQHTGWYYRLLALLLFFLPLGLLAGEKDDRPCSSSNTAVELCKNINVSLDENCGVRVHPEMVLANDTIDPDDYVVDIFFHNQSIGDSIDLSYLGETLIYSVTDTATGNNCWGKILVEDKFAPLLTCTDDTVNCVEFMDTFNTSKINVVEHCQSYKLRILDERVRLLNCDSNYLKSVTRRIVAEDASGNVSDTCSQTVLIERFPLGEVTLSGQDTSIYCGSRFRLDQNGFIVPRDVSIPEWNGIPLYPMRDFFCNLSVEYEDVLMSEVRCTKRWLRTWTITEWFCQEDRNVIRQQLITIIDTAGPDIQLPRDTIKGKAGQRSCDALVHMPTAVVSDACNGIERVDMVYPGGFSGDQNGGYIRLPIGLNEVVYRVFDSCYNMSTDTLLVEVEDRVAPIAICQQNTTVALDNDGLTQVRAEIFDDGSFDECAVDRFEVRRMDDTCGTGTDWGPYVEFCCNDLDRDVMVGFRVIDKSGNVGQCMVNVRVQDKQKPTIVGLPTIRISCRFDFDPNNTEVFGKFVTADSLRDSIILDADFVQFIGQPLDGVYRDNCPPVIEEEVDTTNLNNCGLGYVVRLFTFTDGQGNVETHSQSIFFENLDPLDSIDVIWPEHLDTMNVCGLDSLDPELLPDTFGFPRFPTEDECSLVGVDYKDQVIDASQGNEACFKILREWKVIDWCQKVNGEHRQWTYIQVIENANTIAPVIDSASCKDTLKCVYNTNCDPDSITLVATATDDCTDSLDLFWTYKIDLGNDGSFEIEENGNDASGVYPIDTHKIKFVVEDLCGNKDSCIYLFELRNCKGPLAYCKPKVIAELTPVDTNGGGFDDEIARINAEIFDDGSSHFCGHPLAFSFDSVDISDSIRIFNCDSLGPAGDDTIKLLQIFVIDTITGQFASCIDTLILQDNNNVSICPEPLRSGNVAGQLRTQDKREIKSIDVELMNSGFAMQETDHNGEYAFPDMPFGGIYDVVPKHDEDHINGVSTADLVAIQRHLLGKQIIQGPYNLIAADVNNSGNLSAADISEIRKLILGRYSEFSNNTSWRFVDADYTFRDPQTPWKDNWPEKYHIEPFNGDMKIDFVGMKIGDVTGDVAVNGADDGNKPRGAMTLFTEDRELTRGERVSIPVTFDQLEEVQGFQFTLEWNFDFLRFARLVPNNGLDIGMENFNLEMTDKGILTACWHTTSIWHLPSDMQKTIFTIEFEVDRDGRLSDLIELSDRITRNEVIGKANRSLGGLSLAFEDETISNFFKLYQNEPNPWNDVTRIDFHIPKDEEVRFTIFSEDGRILYRIKDTFKAGPNELYIHRDKLPDSGVLFYRLDTRSHSATRKMIIM